MNHCPCSLFKCTDSHVKKLSGTACTVWHVWINFTQPPSLPMCPADRINLSVAPRCLVQLAICQKLDPKLHMPAAVCKGPRQTMSGTMGLAVPLAERLSCQLHKKPHARRERKVWPRGQFMLSESFAWRPFTSPHFLLHHFLCEEKKKSVPEAPVEGRRLEGRQLPQCSSWGNSVAEAMCQVLGVFF